MISATRQFCTFFVGDGYFGIDVLDVQEIVPTRPLTPVPLAHPAVCGLMNLRGQIVTAIDLRRRLGLPDREAGSESVNIVVRTADGSVSIVVDDVGDVLDADDDRFEIPPETLSDFDRELIAGVYKLPDRLLVVLNAAVVVAVSEAVV